MRVLLSADPAHYDELSESDRATRAQEYSELARETTQHGIHATAETLHPITTATTVRIRNGKILTTDGTFAETTEHLIAYYILHAKNLDQALDYAARIPDAQHGSIEIRPLLELPPPPINLAPKHASKANA